MAAKYDHLREKAIELRTRHHMTLDEIIERLQLPKTTIYYWIKDYPIEKTQAGQPLTPAEQRRNEENKARYARKRQDWYDIGWAEAPTLLTTDLKVRDFVLMYIGEGTKRMRNIVSIGNSDPAVMKMSNEVMKRFTLKQPLYQLQIHIDHDEDELQTFWGNLFGVTPSAIHIIRKSNSNHLSGRQFRSVYGVCSIRMNDTYFRSRLQAWIDFVKSTW